MTPSWVSMPITTSMRMDEVLFYRDDGTFKFYATKPDGSLRAFLSGGTDYSKSWSSIPAVDLDGDGTDEMLFYRASDGVCSSTTR